MDTILLIDDSEIVRKLFSRTLKDIPDCTVITAQSGEKGIQKALEIVPTLIILDISMPPGITGFETCQQLKENPSSKNIPVIFHTAASNDSEILTCFNVGGIDYISKTWNNNIRKERIQTHLNTIRSQRQLKTLQNQLLYEAHKEGQSNTLTKILHTIGNDLSSLILGNQQVERAIENINLEKFTQINTLLEDFLKEELNEQKLPKGLKICEFYNSLQLYIESIFDKIDSYNKKMTEKLDSVNTFLRWQHSLTDKNTFAKKENIYQFITMITEKYLSLEHVDISLMIHNKEVEAFFNIFKLEEVISELIDNAIHVKKFCNQKKLIIMIVVDQLADELIIQVSNNGPVIPEEQHHTIFNHGVSFINRNGFGLHNAVNILREINGNLQILPTSVTTFAITLPAYYDNREFSNSE